MNPRARYSLEGVAHDLRETLKQYLEAQYHIWDEHLVRERRRLLDTVGVVYQEAYLEATPSYVLGPKYADLHLPDPATDILSRATAAGAPAVPYVHQARALEAFLNRGKDLVIATGTGSGKTESFLLPILAALAMERAKRPMSYERPSVRALLLYPMNALVNDQLARLRRLLGAPAVAKALEKRDGFRTTFGMYTSRTPYPGPRTKVKDRDRLQNWIRDFFTRYESQQAALAKEGKWPAKDLRAFEAALKADKRALTSPVDSELFSRHEMHARPPDILVTNYSMLEYMLLRPIERSMFDKTEEWLREGADNRLIVVLDEAHLYQGAQGSEVALLLRRLVSRLRVPRDRVQFILTSASLAGGPGADETTRRFASELTGADPAKSPFELISGDFDIPKNGRTANASESRALREFDYSALHNLADGQFTDANTGLKRLAQEFGIPWDSDCHSISSLQDRVFSMLAHVPVASQLVGSVMGAAKELTELAHSLFPAEEPDPRRCLDSLVALTNFGRRASDERVHLPSRLHLLFRGLEGIFACTNANCTERKDRGSPTLLGRLYATPRLRCPCGSRVYELLTHRDCGAAYLRGFAQPNAGGDIDFLWHEGSTGRSAFGLDLLEVHLLVEAERDQSGRYDYAWLHTVTGQVQLNEPRNQRAFLRLKLPREAPVPVEGNRVVTFPKECPVCLGTWQEGDAPKIMDLATKGEAPLAHLVTAQVRLQPATIEPSFRSPNAGRKSLIFSDGRQKAARLARDLPREVEKDAFRQALLLAFQQLMAVRGEARVGDRFLYPAFLSVAEKRHLTFFDGESSRTFNKHLQHFERRYGGDLAAALDDWNPEVPEGFYVQVLRALGSRNYSLFALALAYPRPRASVLREVLSALGTTNLESQTVEPLATIWIQGMLGRMALYSEQRVDRTLRRKALGFFVPTVGASARFERALRTYLNRRLKAQGIAIEAVEDAFQVALCDQASDKGYILRADDICFVLAADQAWYGCPRCTYLSPVTLFHACAHCGSPDARLWSSDAEYLRARKSYFREPVLRVLANRAQPMTLDVREHTAQLGYRDVGQTESTTEEYERRFRDILLDAGMERSIDVLSCTTTMEVGIDIGTLAGVALRNMPPSRHNYQQRAGRAGRRGSAVSTVVTYAQNSPHDCYLFEHPVELITGHPHITNLDVQNPVLVWRHVFAEILQDFFRLGTAGIDTGNDVFSTLGHTQAFYTSDDDTSLNALKRWLAEDDEAARTIARIEAWIPDNCGVSAPTAGDSLIRALERCRQAAAGPLSRDEEKLIEFLFANGLLPAYAFPRDLISLEIQRRNRNEVETVERAQQGSSIALSEYAPGRRVVVNKLTYRIGAVSAAPSTTDADFARKLFASPPTYLQCVNCLHTREPTAGVEGQPCPTCERAQLESIVAIQPQAVWPEAGVALPEEDDDEDHTETTIAQLPVPSSDEAFGNTREFGARGELAHGRTVKLIKVNRGRETSTGPSAFHVCPFCGHATLDAAEFTVPHHRDYLLPNRPPFRGRELCYGQSRRVYLGYEFSTDVLLLRAHLQTPIASNLSERTVWPPLEDALMSLAQALAIAGARRLGIDVRELQCGHRLRRTKEGVFGDVYLYDTLSGGAGYAKQLGDLFPEVFGLTKQLLAHCSGSCSPSCSKCLRVYSNRFSHERLDRMLALDLANYIESGRAPPLFEVTEQRRGLAPFTEMLNLAGWNTDLEGTCALTASRGNVRRRISLIPSLWDVAALPENVAAADIHLRHFDIERDLPSCLQLL